MSNKIRYKLTDQNMKTCGGFQWELGVWKHATGNGKNLCSNGWLHCYSHPLVAIFMNPIHANIINPRLFKCEVKGEHLDDRGLKEGLKEMRLIKEIPLPEITTTNRVAFGILAALEVYKEETFVKWAEDWLSGKDRNASSAACAARAASSAACAARAAADADAAEAADAAARAADAAACKLINLIKIAKQAMKVK